MARFLVERTSMPAHKAAGAVVAAPGAGFVDTLPPALKSGVALGRDQSGSHA